MEENTPSPEITPSVHVSPLQMAALALKTEIQKVIVGQNESIDLMLAGMLSGGHDEGQTSDKDHCTRPGLSQ